MTAPVLVARSLYRFCRSGDEETLALQGVSLHVRPGELVAVTGPSGSGKSTLLHLLAGLEHPTAGAIEWPSGRTGIGIVFQGPSLLPTLDVTENVALPLLLAGDPHREASTRARQALDRLDIADRAAARPDTLSGGQAQRVAIARVLAARPLLILADEPTGQLDRRTADHVMAVLLDTAGEVGAALVVATHDPAIADRLAQRWEMRDGRLVTGRCW